MKNFNFNPDDLKGLADKFGKIFDEMLESDYYSINRYIPDMIGNINRYNDIDNYYFDILLPGYKKESIKVSVEEFKDGNIIKIKAISLLNKRNEYVVYEKFQFNIKPFNKEIEVPKDATKEMSAKYEDGILKLTLKKIVNTPKTTEVNID